MIEGLAKVEEEVDIKEGLEETSAKTTATIEVKAKVIVSKTIMGRDRIKDKIGNPVKIIQKIISSTTIIKDTMEIINKDSSLTIYKMVTNIKAKTIVQ